MLHQQIPIAQFPPSQMMSRAAALPRPAPARALADPPGLDVPGMSITVRSGQTIYRDGDPSTYCYRLVSGGARIVKLVADGRRGICEFVMPGDYLGLEAGPIYACSAEAVTHSILWRYRRRDIEANLQRNTSSALGLVRILARAVETSRRRAAYSCRMSASERVARFLLDLADRLPHAKDGEIQLPMARSDIGDYLGIATETVSRVFTSLRAQGAIALSGTRGVRLLDRELLEDIHDET
ncbi:MAG: helix-turn-helix domain-containing protein [Rhodospirillaceae bacterium]|nr:helix-turn-helix domain-containing protein [Rhodospirillaceae bacterium]